MTINLQDFRAGSPMWNIVRGYNERRNVIGLPYRAYADNQWADVALLSDATVSSGAIIQDVKFWNELLSIPVANSMSVNSTTYHAAFVEIGPTTITEIENISALVSVGDVLNNALIDRITEFYAQLNTVVYSPVRYAERLVSTDTRPFATENRDITQSRDGNRGAAIEAFQSLGDVFNPGDVNTASWPLLYMRDFDLTPTVTRYSWSPVFGTIPPSGIYPYGQMSLYPGGNFDGSQHFNVSFPLSYSYWSGLGAVDSSSSFDFWSANISYINLVYDFNFTS